MTLSINQGIDKSTSVMERFYIHYQSPVDLKESGVLPIGAKEDWLERVEIFNDNMLWMLQLDQQMFWTELTRNEKAMKAVVSFLQESTPYYMLDTFPDDDAMWKKFHQASHLVFLIFNRITTHFESPTENMTPQKLGELIYNNYLITIPILLDLCVLYGQDNRARVSQMIQTIFQVQPKYKEDLIKAVPYFSKVFRTVQSNFKGRVTGQQNGEPMKLAERNGGSSDVTLLQFRDVVIHVLDAAVNLSTFLDIYTPACHIFHDQLFETNIVNFYQTTIPEMYAKLESLSSSAKTVSIYNDLHYKLDLARVFMLKIFRYIISSIINGVLEKTSTLSEADMKELMEDYVYTLTSCIAEKGFMRDYHTYHPVDQDLDVLSQLCPEMDFTKCDYLIESVLACFDTPPIRKPQRERAPPDTNHSKPPSMQNGTAASSSRVSGAKKKVKGVELDSLITEVKDILPHLGEGYIQNCLEHFEFESATVINAVLEDTLPPFLKAMDFSLPKIPPEIEVEDVATSLQRLNVFDNDEFDVMTQDEVDVSRVHKGKRKPQHKNLKEMIDDKSHRTELRDLYTKFGVVDTEGSMYDDEYDDTYDHVDVSVGEAGDQERRPIVVPRVLRALEKQSSSEEESGEEEEASAGPRNEGRPPNGPRNEGRPPNRDDFVQNPEELRAKAEQRRLSMRGFRHGGGQAAPSRDVAGGPKGQGQDKKVLINRDHKTKRGNPNRRSGAQRKRQQGMIPS